MYIYIYIYMMCIYIYVYIHKCVCSVCVYIYIYLCRRGAPQLRQAELLRAQRLRLRGALPRGLRAALGVWADRAG